MRGRPGRRERRRQHRRTPARRHRSTVAGWISTSASRHWGHNHRNNSQNRRSAGRKRLFVSNSSSGGDRQLDQVAAVGDPPHLLQIGSGVGVSTSVGQRRVALQ